MTIELTSTRAKRSTKIILVGGAVALGIGLGACGGSSDSSSSPSASVSDTPTADSMASGATLPSGWDAPEPANTTLKSGSTLDGVLVASFEGVGDLGAAADAFAKQLQADGWKADENNIANTNSIWFKGNKRLQVSGVGTASDKYVLEIVIEPR